MSRIYKQLNQGEEVVYLAHFHWTMWLVPLLLSGAGLIVAFSNSDRLNQRILSTTDMQLRSQLLHEGMIPTVWLMIAYVAFLVAVMLTLSWTSAEVGVTSRRVIINMGGWKGSAQFDLDSFVSYEIQTSESGDKLGYVDVLFRDDQERTYVLPRVVHGRELAEQVLNQCNVRILTHERTPWIQLN